MLTRYRHTRLSGPLQLLENHQDQMSPGVACTGDRRTWTSPWWPESRMTYFVPRCNTARLHNVQLMQSKKMGIVQAPKPVYGCGLASFVLPTALLSAYVLEPGIDRASLA
jgi:hypothetical protein